MEDSTTKKCPFCNEDINVDAKKCRFCGKWLSTYKDEQNKSSSENASDVVFGCISPLLKFAIPLIIAYYTVPSDEKLERTAINSAVECIVESYSDNKLADVLGAGEIWSTLVYLNEQEIAKDFVRKNSIQVNKKWFWSSAKIYNSKCYDGEVIMFSIFSFNIPMIDIDDIEH